MDKYTYSFKSCIRGYHEYKDIWDAAIGKVLDRDAERKALEAVQPVAHASSQGDESDSDDDISVIEPTPLTLVKATEAVKAIRDFITLDDSGEREREFLSSLSAMEDAFSRLQVKQMRKTKLEKYFN